MAASARSFSTAILLSLLLLPSASGPVCLCLCRLLCVFVGISAWAYLGGLLGQTPSKNKNSAKFNATPRDPHRPKFFLAIFIYISSSICLSVSVCLPAFVSLSHVCLSLSLCVCFCQSVGLCLPLSVLGRANICMGVFRGFTGLTAA